MPQLLAVRGDELLACSGGASCGGRRGRAIRVSAIAEARRGAEQSACASQRWELVLTCDADRPQRATRPTTAEPAFRRRTRLPSDAQPSRLRPSPTRRHSRFDVQGALSRCPQGHEVRVAPRSASSAAARRSGVHSESRSRRICGLDAALGARRAPLRAGQPPLADHRDRRAVLVPHATNAYACALHRSSWRVRGSIDQIVIAQHTPAQGGGTALDALIDAAAGILAADSLEGHAGADRAPPAGPAAVRRPDRLRGRGRAAPALRPVFALGTWVERDHGRDALGRQRHHRLGGRATAARGTSPTRRFDDDQHRRPGHRPTTTRRSSACRCSPTTASSARSTSTASGDDRAFTDAEVALVERFATMAALAYEAARQREHLRHQAATDGLTGLLNHRGAQERLRREIEAAAARRPPAQRRRRRPRPLQAHQRLARPRRGRQGARRGGRQAALGRPRGRRRRPPRRRGVRARPARRRRRGRRRGRRARPHRPRRGGRRPPPAGVLGRRRHVPGATRSEAAELLEHADAALYAAKHAGRRQTRRYARQPRRPPVARRRAQRGRGAAAPRRRTRSGRSSSRCSSSPPAASAATRRSPASTASPSAGPTSGSPRRTAPASAPSSRRSRCAPRSPSPAAPPARSWPSTSARGALLAPPVADVLPDDLSDIVIELTEHELFTAEVALEARLAELRARGARVALDDAGAGYAGLQQLIRVAPDILKIDRSLVHGAHSDALALRAARGARLVRRHHRRRGLRRGRRGPRRPARARRPRRHLRAGLRARAAGRRLGRAQPRRRGHRRRARGRARRQPRRSAAAPAGRARSPSWATTSPTSPTPSELASAGRRAARLLGAQDVVADVGRRRLRSSCCPTTSTRRASAGPWPSSPPPRGCSTSTRRARSSSATARATRSRSPSSSASATAPC